MSDEKRPKFHLLEEEEPPPEREPLPERIETLEKEFIRWDVALGARDNIFQELYQRITALEAAYAEQQQMNAKLTEEIEKLKRRPTS